MKEMKFRHNPDQDYYNAFAQIWGWNISQAPEKGKQLLTQLISEKAEPKNALLRYHLGLAYLNGFLDTEEADRWALYWFDMSADDLCVSGIRAKRLLLRQIRKEARQGQPDAQYCLARYWSWHLAGRLTRRYYYWLRKSKDQGYPPAEDFWRAVWHPGGPRINDIVEPVMQKMEQGFSEMQQNFERLNSSLVAAHNKTLQKVTELGDNLDHLSEQNHELYEKVQAFFTAMEEQVVASAQKSPKELWKKHEEDLSTLFGQSWENGQLHKESKKSLISAAILLEYATNQQLKDCRGIVISVTSVLERELKARFYDGFRTYLVRTYLGEQRYPDSLRKTFTLGSFFHIICDTKKDYSGGKSLTVPKPDGELELIDAYLETIVTEGEKSSGGETRYSDIFINRGGINSFSWRVKRVQYEYRNKAAHTDPVNYDAAKACSDFVVAGSQVENIIGMLVELLHLTQKFKHTV